MGGRKNGRCADRMADDRAEARRKGTRAEGWMDGRKDVGWKREGNTTSEMRGIYYHRYDI